MFIARLAGNVGKGLLAGLLGTVAMTVSSTAEMKLKGRGGSSAPVDAASKVLGIESFATPEAEARFGSLVHWAYGTSWGGLRGALATVLSPPQADLAQFAALYGSEHVMLPALDVAPPATEWGAAEVATDALHHIVYATATGAAYRWIDRRA